MAAFVEDTALGRYQMQAAIVGMVAVLRAASGGPLPEKYEFRGAVSMNLYEVCRCGDLAAHRTHSREAELGTNLLMIGAD